MWERAETRFSGAGRRAIKGNRIRPLFNKKLRLRAARFQTGTFTLQTESLVCPGRGEAAPRTPSPEKLCFTKFENGSSRGSLEVREANTRPVNASPLGDFTKTKKALWQKLSGPQREKTGARKQLASCCGGSAPNPFRHVRGITNSG